MIRKILCKLGFHNWKYKEAVYKTRLDRRMGITDLPAIRICRDCNRKEQEDIHCLGMNPPNYVSSWFVVRK